MSIRSTHPEYDRYLEYWELALDSYEGSKAIKRKETKYLPATSGQIEDGYPTPDALGTKSYSAYIKRALYPENYSAAVKDAIGAMHNKPPTIELPPELEKLIEKATPVGESLESFLARINTHQLITGRLGVMGDIRVNEEGVPEPVLLLYTEKSMRNWNTDELSADANLNFMVLDETTSVVDDNFQWTSKERYRLLAVTDGEQITSNGAYVSGLFEEEQDITLEGMQSPVWYEREASEIPFVCINATDLSFSPDKPPLDGLAELCLAIYRGEADYRQNLFMQGQDTLVKQGTFSDDDEVTRTGTGAVINVPADGDAKYIGVNSNGLPEQRQSLENDYKKADKKSGNFLDSSSKAKESGEALRIRNAAGNASLHSIAKTGAAGLALVLKKLAKWAGADPEKVVVKPNLEFTEPSLNSKTLVELVQSKAMGATISNQSIHNYAVEQGFTRVSYEEELERINNEQPSADTFNDVE